MSRCGEAGSASADGPLRPVPLLLIRFDLLRARLRVLLVLAHFELIRQLHHLVVQRRVILEHIGYRGLLEDRLPRTLGLARAAIDALVGMDIELIREGRSVATGVAINTID